MGMRSTTPYSLYELLVVGLVLQNAQIRRSVQMLEILIDRFGTRVAFDEVTVDTLWPPDALDTSSEDELRALRIGYRAKSLLRFSRQFASGTVDEHALRQLGDSELKQALLNIYGVGPETARILMSEAFHRHTAFDHIAPWQQKILSRLLYNKRIVSVEKIIADAASRYGPYATLAIHYLWEDLFWQHRSRRIDWLDSEIRL